MLSEYTAVIEFVTGACILGGMVWGYVRFVHAKVAAWWLPWATAIKSLGQLPVALASFSTFQTQLDGISKQVATDDGHPIFTAVKRIEYGLYEAQGLVNNASARLEGVGAQVTRLSCTMRVNQDSDPRRATFECHADGRTDQVNKTYLRWAGRTDEEVLGYGWLNAVHVEDRARVREEWHQAVAESRTCSVRYRMVSTSGEVFMVESTATPIPEGQAPPDRWIGLIFKVDK